MQQSKNDGIVAIAFVAVTIGLFGFFWWAYNYAGKPPSSTVTSGCVSASGRIWSDVQLYLDSTCNTPQAVVIGGKDDRVKVRFPSGSEEWKTREVVRSLYVKAEDPAIKAQQWIEP